MTILLVNDWINATWVTLFDLSFGLAETEDYNLRFSFIFLGLGFQIRTPKESDITPDLDRWY